MSMSIAELERTFAQLRLSGARDTLQTRLEQAQASQMTAQELLALLLQDELDRRQSRLIGKRYKDSRLDEKVTLAEIDWSSSVMALSVARCSSAARTQACSTIAAGCLRARPTRPHMRRCPTRPSRANHCRQIARQLGPISPASFHSSSVWRLGLKGRSLIGQHRGAGAFTARVRTQQRACAAVPDLQQVRVQAHRHLRADRRRARRVVAAVHPDGGVVAHGAHHVMEEGEARDRQRREAGALLLEHGLHLALLAPVDALGRPVAFRGSYRSGLMTPSLRLSRTT
jgi:hypothetical protein